MKRVTLQFEFSSQDLEPSQIAETIISLWRGFGGHNHGRGDVLGANGNLADRNTVEVAGGVAQMIAWETINNREVI